MNPILDAVSTLSRVNQQWAGFIKDAAQKQSTDFVRLMRDDIEDQRTAIKSVSQQAIDQIKNPEAMLSSATSLPLFFIKLQTLWFQQALEAMIAMQRQMGAETKEALHHWQEQNARLLKHAIDQKPTRHLHETPSKGSRRENGAVHHRGFPER
ncbi:MAG: hypothetical protein RL258_281 [Pseudomonadota bacterium]|jgi:hypothetical protein